MHRNALCRWFEMNELEDLLGEMCLTFQVTVTEWDPDAGGERSVCFVNGVGLLRE